MHFLFSKIFPLAPPMLGPWFATEPWKVYSPESLPLLPEPLENSETLHDIYFL